MTENKPKGLRKHIQIILLLFPRAAHDAWSEFKYSLCNQLIGRQEPIIAAVELGR
jgi:hypothetical protein